jgi:hypothetical protein
LYCGVAKLKNGRRLRMERKGSILEASEHLKVDIESKYPVFLERGDHSGNSPNQDETCKLAV